MPTPDELYDEGIKLKDDGKLDAAVAKLEEALSQDERFALAHSALAVTCTKMGLHDRAIQHAERVVELEPRDPFSYMSLSVTYQRAGKIPEAESAMAMAQRMQMGG